MFFPAQHEGEEASSAVVYTGSVPNQSFLPVADYLARRDGPRIQRWFIIGTDYVTPAPKPRCSRARGAPPVSPTTTMLGDFLDSDLNPKPPAL